MNRASPLQAHPRGRVKRGLDARGRRTIPLLSAVLLALMAGCAAPGGSFDTPEVVRSFPHDPGAYTQGLLLHEGLLYESTGRYGESTLREVDPRTGEVLRQIALDSVYFGEGLARVENRLIQLTWKEGRAFVYDIESFEQVGEFEYDTEGWGLCYDGEVLWMTSGSHMLYRRDPDTFALLGGVPVTRNGNPVRQLNELECVGPHVYANLFQTDRIVRIDKRTGSVVAEIDATALIPEGGRPSDPEAVLNGIAYDPNSETFYLTGKLWRTMFEVRFVTAPTSAGISGN